MPYVHQPCACMPSPEQVLTCSAMLPPQMASVELWSEVMFRAQDAVDRETQPLRSANEHIGLFFVLFMVRPASMLHSAA